jgi:hypothetical protein
MKRQMCICIYHQMHNILWFFRIRKQEEATKVLHETQRQSKSNLASADYSCHILTKDHLHADTPPTILCVHLAHVCSCRQQPRRRRQRRQRRQLGSGNRKKQQRYCMRLRDRVNQTWHQQTIPVADKTLAVHILTILCVHTMICLSACVTI